MAMIERMYQYSLQYFKNLFKFNIEESEKSDDVAKRVETIINVCTEEIFFNICRGLFEKDKMLFAYMITAMVMRHSKSILDANWSFFVSGSGCLDTSKIDPYPGGVWMDFNRWVEICELDRQSETFRGLSKMIIDEEAEWQAYCESDEPHKNPFPSGLAEKLNSFQRVLLLKILRPEKVVFTVPQFISENLGKQYVESQPFDLAAPYQASNPETPIIFVLSTGADPSPYLFKLAREIGFYDKLKVISLGQGQGPKAEALIESAVKDGERMKWVCLQNCHLAGSWMPTLERILENLSVNEKPHKDFRLFLTSMPSETFPVTILQNGIKLTNEPPKGLRANVRGSYTDIDPDVFEACEKPAPWKKLLFGMCFFHAVIQERRKFGALGWNIRYDWNNSDRSVSVKMLMNYLDEQDVVPFPTLQYVIGVVNYGGRVTDAWDQRCVSVIYKKFCVPELLDDAHRFDQMGLYYCPEEGDMDSYKSYIENLPMSESPDIFGLHPNAEITFQQQEAAALMENVIKLSPVGAGSGDGAMKPEDIVLDIARNIIKKLEDNLDPEDAHAETYKLDPSGALNSLGLFHSMEVIKFNELLSKMRKTLGQLELAMQGLSVMSAELETMYQEFLIQKSPPNWQNLCYVSLKPLGAWCEDLFARVRMMDLWMKEGPPNLFWLAGMYFPQGFMTAVLQRHSRKTAIPIDTLAFQADVKTDMKNSPLCPLAMKVDDEVADDFATPEDGVHVFGMFLQGARWNRSKGCIEDSINGELFTPLPIIWLEPIVPEVLKPANAFISQREGCYRCPMYKTSTRAGTLSTTGHSTNYVVCLDIPHGGQGEDKWTCCGVAMLCMLDD
jgi:dynein heavy chain